MKEKSFKHFLASVFCFCLAALMAIASPVALAAERGSESEASAASETNPSEQEYRDQISNLQDEQVKIQQEMKDYNNKINNIKDDKKKQQAIVNTIDEKISITEKAIAVGNEKIELTNKYIADKNAEIDKKDQEIEYTLQLFRDRVRAIYMTGGYSDSTNALLMLLSSSSVTEFLARSEYLERIAEHDKQLMLQLREDLALLEKEKALLEEEKAALEEEKAALEKEQQELESQRKVAKDSIHDLSAMQKEYEANYAELSAMQKEIQAELLDIYKNLNTSNEAYVGGEMMWPVPGYSKISSYYGWRFNNTDFHTGIDITGSGVHGAPVVAANTGTVVHTKTCPYNGYSYGYGTYIIVDHGGGITTLYAHLSAINVNVGDIVVMGQQIGKVGNTGWSTGAHLHFEVRKNGSAVNPISYIT